MVVFRSWNVDVDVDVDVDMDKKEGGWRKEGGGSRSFVRLSLSSVVTE